MRRDQGLLRWSGVVTVLVVGTMTGPANAGDFVASRIVAATSDGEYVAGYLTRDRLVAPGSCGVWSARSTGSRKMVVSAMCFGPDRLPLPLAAWRWEHPSAVVDALRVLDEIDIRAARIRVDADGRRRLQVRWHDTWVGTQIVEEGFKISAVLEVGDGILVRVSRRGVLSQRDVLWKVRAEDAIPRTPAADDSHRR